MQIRNMTWLFAAVVCCSISTTVGSETLFEEDFESDLSQWTGTAGGNTSGAIVVDPLDASNRVLTFNALTSAGDIFTQVILKLEPGERYFVIFDYLGFAQPGSVTGNFGGYAGLSSGLPGSRLWYYATTSQVGAQGVLSDDGAWGTYVYEFTPPVDFTLGGGSSSSVHLMFQDWVNSNGVAGDTFWDNIRVIGCSGSGDADGDGISDSADNCVFQPNADQRDTNGDGRGNICDPDLNDDLIVNALDLGLLKATFFCSDSSQNCQDADFNGDGVVNAIDLGLLKANFFEEPGATCVAP